jgi:DNA-binding CsgD family transcriptional regulator/catechol 2,3-dioxygenase-like lactoylglutathione lyase family enzyme
MTELRGRGRPPHDDILTPAEWRVLEFVRHGLSNRQIAERHGFSLDAVKYHVANMLQKLGFSSRAELRAWRGISRGSAMHGMEQSQEGWEMGPIGQISRQVKDVAAARAWFQDVLGLKHLYSFGNLAFFDCGGVRLFLSESEQAGDGESIIYFQVPDIRAAQERLEASGATFLNAPHMIHRHEDGTEEWMAFFNDNEGRPLAIMAQVRAQAD